MSSRKYQMKKEEPKYVNMKGKTVGNNNAVGGGGNQFIPACKLTLS